MEITVRLALPADAEFISAGNCATALETEEWILNPANALAGVRAVLGDPSRGFYLVAEFDGAVVGQCMVTFEWSDYRFGLFWWIQSVYVRPEARRRGIFLRLFQTVESMARASEDVTGLRLYVESRNRAAQEAYIRAGMQRAPYVLLEQDWGRSG